MYDLPYDLVELAFQERLEKGGAVFSVVLNAEITQPVEEVFALKDSSEDYEIDKVRVKGMWEKGKEEDSEDRKKKKGTTKKKGASGRVEESTIYIKDHKTGEILTSGKKKNIVKPSFEMDPLLFEAQQSGI